MHSLKPYNYIQFRLTKASQEETVPYLSLYPLSLEWFLTYNECFQLILLHSLRKERGERQVAKIKESQKMWRDEKLHIINENKGEVGEKKRRKLAVLGMCTGCYTASA